MIRKTTVTLPYSPFWEPLTWAKENCPSYITNDLHQDGYNTYDHTKIDYFFGNEKDAVWFSLRWAA
jgi:hypothetical protein